MISTPAAENEQSVQAGKMVRHARKGGTAAQQLNPTSAYGGDQRREAESERQGKALGRRKWRVGAG